MAPAIAPTATIATTAMEIRIQRRLKSPCTGELKRAGYAVDHPPSAVTWAPLTLEASSLASHEISVAIWSGSAGDGIVAIESIARSMAQGTAGAALLPIDVATGPGSTALDRMFFGP